MYREEKSALKSNDDDEAKCLIASEEPERNYKE